MAPHAILARTLHVDWPRLAVSVVDWPRPVVAAAQHPVEAQAARRVVVVVAEVDTTATALTEKIRRYNRNDLVRVKHQKTT